MQFILNLDRTLFTFINSYLWVPWMGKTMFAFTILGYGYVLLPLTWILILTLDRKNFLRTFVLLFFSSFLGWIMVMVLKEVVKRPRPPSFFSQVNVLGPMYKRGSFPSGHAQLAFSVAIILKEKYKKATLPLMTVSGLIAFSRVYVGVHFPLDVIVGSFIGYLSARAVLGAEKYFKGKHQIKSAEILPENRR